MGRDVRNGRGWPKNGQSLSNIVTRMAPNLRAFGVELVRGTQGTGSKKHRIIDIRFTEPSEIVQQRLRSVVSLRPSDMVKEGEGEDVHA